MQKLNYCKSIAIVHGQSEYFLARHIKSNLHLPMGIYADKNGKKSIQIDSLMNILKNTTFNNKGNFLKEYEVETRGKELVNFALMPIMDLDDTSEENVEKYKSGKMFEGHWLSPYIVPIWNDKKLDDVMLELGLIEKLPKDEEKGEVYRKIFPVHKGETDFEQIKALSKKFEKSSKTNMEVFIKECLKNVDDN